MQNSVLTVGKLCQAGFSTNWISQALPGTVKLASGWGEYTKKGIVCKEKLTKTEKLTKKFRPAPRSFYLPDFTLNYVHYNP